MVETIEVEVMVLGGPLDGNIYICCFPTPLPMKLMACEVQPYMAGVFELQYSGVSVHSGKTHATYALREDDQFPFLEDRMQAHLECRQENLVRKSRKPGTPPRA